MPIYEVKTRLIHDTSGQFSRGDVTHLPCPAILIGPNSVNSRHYQLEYYLTEDPPPMPALPTNKPPYHVPSMQEIAQTPWNGFNAISTFSGTGGSCLGYRMAGFRLLWANEFIPAAQESYKANHPDSILDPRDIRQITPNDILSRINLKVGEIDLMDGSPPCASFSTAGKREKGWGSVKKYSDSEQRTDDLFFEYARLVKALQPKVFVAENVSGLVKGTAKGYFQLILKELKDCGYKVSAKLLDAQWLGVPQQRQRIIFIGVRNDLGLNPVHPDPLPYRYTVREAIPWIVKLKLGGAPDNWKDSNRPAGTVVQSDGARTNTTAYLSSYLIEAETDISRFAIGEEWEKLALGQRSDKYINLRRENPDAPAHTVTAMGGNQSAASVTHPTEKRKFSIAELRRICGFPDDFILTGSYEQQWERLGRAVPPVMMSHVAATVRDQILKKLPK
jgi:DNA (cytosine-5)-methyltransferase 1